MYESDYFSVKVGDVIELDGTSYAYGMDASGSLVLLGQHGSQFEDEFAFQESIEGDHIMSPMQPELFHTAQPFPTHKIGKRGELLKGKAFVIVSMMPVGPSDEDMYRHDIDRCDDTENGWRFVADEMYINEHRESYIEGEAVRLRVSFNQGGGFEHCMNYPKIIGHAPVERTYTIGCFKPRVK